MLLFDNVTNRNANVHDFAKFTSDFVKFTQHFVLVNHTSILDRICGYVDNGYHKITNTDDMKQVQQTVCLEE